MCVYEERKSLELGFWSPLQQMVDQGIKTPETGEGFSHRWMGLSPEVCAGEISFHLVSYCTQPSRTAGENSITPFMHPYTRLLPNTPLHVSANPCQSPNAQPHPIVKYERYES